MSASAALWAVFADVVDLTPPERKLLDLAAAQADDVAALEALLQSQGLVVTGSTGQPKLSPVVGELRQSRQALARMLSDLAEGRRWEGEARDAVFDIRARRAARRARAAAEVTA